MLEFIFLKGFEQSVSALDFLPPPPLPGATSFFMVLFLPYCFLDDLLKVFTNLFFLLQTKREPQGIRTVLAYLWIY